MVNLRHGIYESACFTLEKTKRRPSSIPWIRGHWIGRMQWRPRLVMGDGWVRWDRQWLGHTEATISHTREEAFVRIGNLMMMMMMMVVMMVMMMVVMMVMMMMTTMFLQNNSWFSAGFCYTSEHKKAGAPKSLEVDDSDGFFFSECVCCRWRFAVRGIGRNDLHVEFHRWPPRSFGSVPSGASRAGKQVRESQPCISGTRWIFWPLGISVGIFVKKTRNMIGTSISSMNIPQNRFLWPGFELNLILLSPFFMFWQMSCWSSTKPVTRQGAQGNMRVSLLPPMATTNTVPLGCLATTQRPTKIPIPLGSLT